MSESYNEDIEPERDSAPESAPEPAPEPPTSGPMSDPRLRPPDPAGTQPKYEPQSLLPRRKLTASSATLWAPPSEDADEHAEHEIHPRREDEAPAAQDDGDVATPPTYSRYSHRVQFALGALLAIGAAGIILLVAALVGNGSSKNSTVTLNTGPAWSAWRPTATSGADAATQIAEHVSRQYRLPNGQQLVLATGGPMEIANLPVTVAIQEPAAKGGNIDLVDGAGVLFRLCGVGGSDCHITYGKPSVNRHLLLAREALEMALYSFRYLGVNQAVVIMPPSVKTTTGANGKAKSAKSEPEALLFRRDDPGVAVAVQHPLNSTLATKTPTVGSVTRSPDAGTVSTLTMPNIFSFRFQQSNQDARAFLVLNPLG